ncbi:translation initiation factor [Rhodopirellula baltica]|uniref:Translation initiation factor 1, prokaryotic n=1 Tax=Rhodopirellula baltica SWK14 TaxID=993516 RepID=L7CIF3_RHOBT|nr:translation initiation factor [Rhodopirellula baltica]ELP34009.1 Translation initiation factor 1, prokaryotic [Rhodopirellula baltica SWK14]
MTRLFAGTPFDIPPTCDLCGQKESECKCTPQQKAEAEAQQQREADRLPPEKQTARVRLDRRKGGRTVTLVEGLTSRANDLPELLGKLQSACGAGGTVKKADDFIELQGDHVERVGQKLAEIGYRLRK